MHRLKLLRTPRSLCAVISVAALAIVLTRQADARAADIVRVEEDWELVVAAPDPTRFAPQITTTMSPIGHVGTVRSLFTINPHNQALAPSGGVQLQAWVDTSPVRIKRAHSGTLLHHANEVITWTQVMNLERGQLRFSVINGQSQTWGRFGQNGELSVQTDTRLANLNRYYHGVSAVNSGVSGITSAPTRVRSLTLGTIRRYSRDGLESRSTTRTLVYAY